jgi:LacI family transcriptional regulator
MGAMAVQTILMMAEGNKPSSRHVELATSLMVRESTAPVSGAG